MEAPATTKLSIGPDQVYLVGEHVVILAARTMPDWTVREFCIRPIYFQNKTYFLQRRLPGARTYAARYELAPWHAELGNASPQGIHYDAEYVAMREREAGVSHRQDEWHSLLFLVFPFLGFCWSRFKQRVLSPIGFDPASITEASIMLALGFFLIEALFVVAFRVGFLAVAFSSYALLWPDRILFVVLPVDCVMRISGIIRGDDSPPGFLEWIFRREKSETSGN